MAIIFNDNFQNNAPKATDNRYCKFVSGVSVPYVSVAEANSIIVYRHVGLTVLIDDGDGNNIQYWYKEGITNGDLVRKLPSVDSFFLTLDGSRPTPGFVYLRRILIKPVTELVAFKAGSSIGGSDYTGGITLDIPASIWYSLIIERYFEASDTIYFTGITDLTNFKIYYE